MSLPRLRPYQEEQKSHSKEFFKIPGNQYLMVVSPTGTGKTTFFSSMIYDNVMDGCSVLVVVHRIELVDQIIERLNLFGLQVGAIASDYPQNLLLPVQVGMVQSQVQLTQFKPDYIYIDECHHSTAATYKNLFEWFPQAKVIGVTATPVRLDGVGFDDIFQKMINLHNMKYFFDNNYLVPPKHYFCAQIPQDNLRVTAGGDYDIIEAAKYLIENNLIIDIVNSYQRYTMGRKAIVFAANVKHSKETADAFNKVGIPAAHIDGSMEKLIRRRIINDFRSGKLLVLVNFDIISEGFDVPDTEAVILGRRTKSLAYYVQVVGRCLRPDPKNGKRFGIVLDCCGQWLEHGFAGVNYEWNLEGNLKKMLNPLVQKKTHVRKNNEYVPVTVTELLGTELISLDSYLQRLNMFDSFLTKYRPDQAYLAVEEYSDYLFAQNADLTVVEKKYIVNWLDVHGIQLSESFWNSHFNSSVSDPLNLS